jgi:hypothetical protein
MKRILLAVVLSLALAVNAFAASSMVVTPYGQSDQGNVFILKVIATAHTDGTFDSKQITASEAGFDYHKAGYRLADIWVVNSATDDHTNAAVVTITDETTRQIVGTAAGDTLSLSQTASGVAYLSIDRGSGQRTISSLITIAIADTGASATVQTFYLVFTK